MLTIREDLPASLLTAQPEDLQQLLGGPTLFHWPGRREPAVFVVVLQHGNETTGWYAVQRLLRKYVDETGEIKLPRVLSLFIGNVAAAAQGKRRLASQLDYNRVWPGGDAQQSPEAHLMAEVLDVMKTRGTFASVDVHNNTGRHPHYACVNHLTPVHLQLATLFNRTVVYFIRPQGVQSMAFGRFCPAITIECGQVGALAGIEHAFEFLDACLHLSHIPETNVAPHDLDLFHTIATAKLVGAKRASFTPGEQGLIFRDDLDQLNFQELTVGTRLANRVQDTDTFIAVTDEAGAEVTDDFLYDQEDTVRLKQNVIPAMLTRDLEIIRDDCVCYFMERMTV